MAVSAANPLDARFVRVQDRGSTTAARPARVYRSISDGLPAGQEASSTRCSQRQPRDDRHATCAIEGRVGSTFLETNSSRANWPPDATVIRLGLPRATSTSWMLTISRSSSMRCSARGHRGRPGRRQPTPSGASTTRSSSVERISPTSSSYDTDGDGYIDRVRFFPQAHFDDNADEPGQSTTQSPRLAEAGHEHPEPRVRR